LVTRTLACAKCAAPLVLKDGLKTTIAPGVTFSIWSRRKKAADEQG
jgi:hypothetical protein